MRNATSAGEGVGRGADDDDDNLDVGITVTPGASCTAMPTLTLRVPGLSGSNQSVYLPLARTGCAR